MIEVELRGKPEGSRDYQTLARVSVREDGTSEVWDPEGIVPFDLPALEAGPPGQHGPTRIYFAERPADWARGLGTILRTGYMVPVITRDDEDGTSPGAGADAADG